MSAQASRSSSRKRVATTSARARIDDFVMICSRGASTACAASAARMREHDEQELCTKLLLDAISGLRVELALTEEVALEQLEELLDGDLAASNGREQEPRPLAAAIDAHGSELDARPEKDAVVITRGLLEDADRVEGALAADDEVADARMVWPVRR